jgi:hypothetical protein
LQQTADTQSRVLSGKRARPAAKAARGDEIGKARWYKQMSRIANSELTSTT